MSLPVSPLACPMTTWRHPTMDRAVPLRFLTLASCLGGGRTDLSALVPRQIPLPPTARQTRTDGGGYVVKRWMTSCGFEMEVSTTWAAYASFANTSSWSSGTWLRNQIARATQHGRAPSKRSSGGSAQ